jgi:ankyrin repeat protein
MRDTKNVPIPFASIQENFKIRAAKARQYYTNLQSQIGSRKSGAAEAEFDKSGAAETEFDPLPIDTANFFNPGQDISEIYVIAEKPQEPVPQYTYHVQGDYGTYHEVPEYTTSITPENQKKYDEALAIYKSRYQEWQQEFLTGRQLQAAVALNRPMQEIEDIIHELHALGRSDVIKVTDLYGRNILHYAALNNNKKLFHYLRFFILDEERDKAGRAPNRIIQVMQEYGEYSNLYQACYNGDIASVVLLLDEMAPLDLIGINKALHYAALSDNYEEAVEIAQLLLEKGANINFQNQYGQSALHIAALKGNVKLVKNLLQQKELIANRADGYGMTPLLYSYFCNNEEIIASLYNRATNDQKKSALYKAVCSGSDLAVSFLLKEDANYTIEYLSQCLLKAASNTNIVMMQLLRDKISLFKNFNQASLIKETLSTLVRSKVTAGSKSQNSYREFDKQEMCCELLRGLNKEDNAYFAELLLDAVKADCGDKLVEDLFNNIKSKPYQENADYFKKLLLEIVRNGKYQEIFASLCVKKIPISDIASDNNLRNVFNFRQSNDLLHEIVSQPNPDLNILDQLLGSKIHGEFRLNADHTISAFLSLFGPIAVLLVPLSVIDSKHRIESSQMDAFSVHHTNKIGDKLIHTALKQATHHPEIIDRILARGICINSKNGDGDTPLHIAVKNGNIQSVRKMLEYDVDITAKNKDGKTPLDIAGLDASKKAIVELLKAKQKEQYEKSLVGRAKHLLASISFPSISHKIDQDQDGKPANVAGSERSVQQNRMSL